MGQDCSDSCGRDTSPEQTVLNPIQPSQPSHWQSIYRIAKMDCPSEERMVRLALNDCPNLNGLSFDLAERRLQVTHNGDVAEISRRLTALGLGAELLETRAADTKDAPIGTDDPTQERRTLWLVLMINALMFIVELVSGWLGESTGLIADSLDMFADAAVYGVSLYAVGRALQSQQRAAHLAGLLQLLLALGALSEVIRRFWFGSDPQSELMIAVSLLALIANVSCLLLIARHRQGGVHMRASWIFSTNDVLANLGVILAGVLVSWTGSVYPDLVIGLLIGLLVLSGAVRILRLRA